MKNISKRKKASCIKKHNSFSKLLFLLLFIIITLLALLISFYSFKQKAVISNETPTITVKKLFPTITKAPPVYQSTPTPPIPTGIESEDRTKILYVQPLNLDASQTPTDLAISLYDKETGKSEIIVPSTINSLTQASGPFLILKWSPSNSYIYTEFGSAVTKLGTVYSFPGGQKITDYFPSEGSAWLDNQTLVINEEYDAAIRPWEGNGRGISVFSFPNEDKHQLLIPSATVDYILLATANGYIYYNQITVNNKDNWSNESSQDSTFWRMDKNGNLKEQVTRNDVPAVPN